MANEFPPQTRVSQNIAASKGGIRLASPGSLAVPQPVRARPARPVVYVDSQQTAIFWNVQQTATCPGGTTGDPVVIPAHTVFSNVSQEEANNQAAALAQGQLVCIPDPPPTLYWNTEQTATCPGGTTGDPVVTPAHTYSSLISQQDADDQAMAAAEALLVCTPIVTYWNTEQTATCPGGTTGDPVVVPPNTYSSIVSQEDADNQAIAAAEAALVCVPVLVTATMSDKGSHQAGLGDASEYVSEAVTFWNTEQTATCPGGTTGDPVVIPDHTYSSEVSQEDADNQAIAAAQAALVCIPDEPPGGLPDNIVTNPVANDATLFGYFSNGPMGIEDLVCNVESMLSGFSFIGVTDLVSLILPNLISIGLNNLENTPISVQQCPAFTTFYAPLFVPTNGQTYTFAGSALNSVSVNALLARCVAAPGYVSGIVDVSGGTNAVPTGQGITDRDTLIVRGVTVLTNDLQ